ncbi:MAG: hypothetical protein Q8L20_03235 [Gammaproteobacteria bacterium]|nr:hypothetical protein [Gammaproteobacteria bacterium]
MVRWTKRLVIAALVMTLSISNALTLTSSAFNALLSGTAAGVFGLKTLYQQNKEVLDRHRAAVKRMGSRMVSRTARMATRSTLGNSLEWIPLFGTSLAVALTAWELSDLCEGLEDLDRLYHDLEIDEEAVPLDVCQSTEEP